MVHNANRLGFTFVFVAALKATAASAAIVDYDASSGQLPQSAGWTFSDENNPPSTVGVSGGVLTLNSTIANRSAWELNPIPATDGNQGLFMEAAMQVVSEQHTRVGRGAALPQVGHSDGVSASGLDLYAWEDRIFVNNFDDVTVGTHFMDTTDGLHTYRVELLRTQYWVFVDDRLVLSGTTPLSPSISNGIFGAFGDRSSFSGGVTQWSRVRIGSLADIGGPTIPEPSTLALAGLALGLCSAWRYW